MARLRGHATDPPGRWKEPRAFAAADHAAQRARQGRGRQPIRRRVRGQCGEAAGARGSLIPHAGAIRALVIAMIEAAFGTAAMAPARGADRGVAGGRATRRRAIRVATITRARRSRRGGCSAGRFSGEAACPRRRSGSALRLDTALKPWHKRDDWLGPSEHRGGHRGSGGPRSRPSPHSPQLDSLQQSNSRGRSAASSPYRVLVSRPPSACMALRWRLQHQRLDLQTVEERRDLRSFR